MDNYVTREVPSIAFVNKLIEHALCINASDIHLEPSSHELRIRMRIDGLLFEENPITNELGLQVLSRLKLLASMNIAERRIPQDGKFTYSLTSKVVDIRVATFPNLYGEKIVLRLLDRHQTSLSLEELGFNAQLLNDLKKIAQRASGFLLVSGPTGSGKTTTLHALLSEAKNSTKNIVTLEDPIEYTVSGITQSQINQDIGFSFEKGIRALLRQDPDIIMVGEIRDKQTAQVALQAALTGHLVLSTVHTNDATSTIMRLLDMGIEPFLLNAATTGIIAQRLVRKNCLICIEDKPITDAEKSFLINTNSTVTRMFKGVGCNACRNTGYKGRVGIFEYLPFSHAIRLLITKEPKFDDLYQRAKLEGMITMQEDAIIKINKGLLSFDEFIRVLF